MTSSRFVSRSGARVAATTAIAAIIIGAVAVTPAVAEQDLGAVITVGTEPTLVDFTPNGLFAYVTNRVADTVSVIDTNTNLAIATIPVGNEPHGVTVSPDGSIVYVTNITSADVSVIDTTTNTVVDTIATGAWAYDAAFTPDGTKAYVTNYFDSTSFPGTTGSVSVIDVATGTVTDYLDTPGGPEGVAVSPDGSTAYVTHVGGGIHVIDTATDSVVDVISSPGFPTAVVFSADGAFAYTSNNTDNNVSIIDVAAGVLIDTLPVDGNFPNDIDISPDGSTVWVSFGEGPTEGIQPLDVATATMGAKVSIGDGATGISGLAVSPAGNVIYVTNSYDDTVSVLGDQVTRTSGTDRYKTAVAVSQASYPAGAEFVFVATGGNFPDALSAGPAAAHLGGPLLLTASNSLPAPVKAEIQRLNPELIILIGGTGVVSAAVEVELQALAPSGVTRLGGANRYETSRNLVRDAFLADGATEVYLATGRNFPDALGAAAVGAGFSHPVILVDGNASSVDAATLQLLADLGVQKIRIAGGTGVVSQAIADQLLGEAFEVLRLGGNTRYETSLAINSDRYTFPGDAIRVFLATGVNFPDALAGSAWAGHVHAPLYIVPGTCIPTDILTEIIELGVFQVTLIGGTGVLTQSVFDLTECA